MITQYPPKRTRGLRNRDALRVEFRGEMLTMREVSERTGVSASALYARRHGGKRLDATRYEDGIGRRRTGVVVQHRDPDFDLDAEWADECVDEVVRRHPDGITLDQVGELIGVTRERVRQIQNTAIRKLRSFRLQLKASDDMRTLRDAYEAMDDRPGDPWDNVPDLTGLYAYKPSELRRQRKAG